MSITRVAMTRATVGALLLLVCASAEASAPAAPLPPPTAPFEADQVIGSLNRTLGWYRQARATMRALEGVSGSVFTGDDERTTVAIVRRAAEVARAEAAVLAQRGGTTTSAASDERRRVSETRAELERAVEGEKAELVRLQQRLRTAPPREHPELQRQIVASANRIALHEARREMLARFSESETIASDVGADLERQIQALQDSVPELRSSAAAPPALAPASPASGTMAIIHRLLALDRSRRSVVDLQNATAQLGRSLDADVRTMREHVAPLAGRLQALAADPTAEGTSLVEGQRIFQELLARVRLVGAIIPPLREEATLVHRYERTLESWSRGLSRDVKEAFENLAVALVGVVIAIIAIFIGAVLWRMAARRYIQDPYRRRLVMMIRRIVVAVGLVLVFVLHFASELTALVAGLGFAAAGIAFALQNVILALAGYFSMMTGEDGIRAGDRVSLQGPFGYVHGDVQEIGLVRIRLRELAGDPLEPTGRVVVFPNSVVFTGSFFKHATQPATTVPRPPESQRA